MAKKNKPIRPRGVWKINPKTRVKPNKKKDNYTPDDGCLWCDGSGEDYDNGDECGNCSGTGLG